MTTGMIELRGVEVHNLQKIDLDLPHQRVIGICGVSGSGKSSLAFDTIYAEGQRRYIESFSAYARQFLARLERPAAERISGLPPAIAVGQGSLASTHRSTVATATEIHDHLRLLFARLGRVHCPACGLEASAASPASVVAWLGGVTAGLRAMIGFPVASGRDSQAQHGAAADGELPAVASVLEKLSDLREQGFVRAIVGERSIDLGRGASESPSQPAAQRPDSPAPNGPLDVWAVVDRTSSGRNDSRLVDSLETALAGGAGRMCVWIEGTQPEIAGGGTATTIDGAAWRRFAFNTALACAKCGLELATPEPRLFSFNSPQGACPACEGGGIVSQVDPALLFPDREATLRSAIGALLEGTAPAEEVARFLADAAALGITPDAPISQLADGQLERLSWGDPAQNFGGIETLLAALERQKAVGKKGRWNRLKRQAACGVCRGARLRPEALSVRLGGRNMAQVTALSVDQASAFLAGLELQPHQATLAGPIVEQIRSRLSYLSTIALGYLPLDRTLPSLSCGEAQRVALTTALGSSLVGMLYVLDEPTIGLHPADTKRLVETIHGLRRRGNTVIVVDHDEELIRSAEQLVEIGPSAGERGGRLVFQGTPAEMEAAPESLTGDYLSGRRRMTTPETRRAARGWIRLKGASGHNLRDVTVEFPLGVLCVVTGVSGAGKSTLVEETLYPALCRRLKKSAPAPLPYGDLFGDGQLSDAILVDQSAIGRSPRSNPVTYVKAFDEIREVFAETLEARTHNYSAGAFSFNIDGGRCPACEGDGLVTVDMQFLADVYRRCEECQGTRYRREILQCLYRGKSIAEVLELTVREAFGFFRGQPKVQSKLKRLMDVGLDYLHLGQPANTLSGGEAQRLKLASYVASAKRSRTLFILDEPTTGLHPYDVSQLLDTLQSLIAVGHSMIVVEHDLSIVKSADWVIDLGPGAAAEGGRIVCEGAPEVIARCRESATGRFLAEALRIERRNRSHE